MTDPLPARPTRRRLAALVALGAVAVAACGDGATTVDVPGLDADGYVTVLADLLPPADAADDTLPVVFVLPLDDPVDLEMQALVIELLEETHDVRFVDDLVAAVDEDDPAAAARDGGVVFGVGTVAPDPPHLIRVERYVDADDVTASLVTLTPRGDGWAKVASQDVPPEELRVEP